MSGRLGRFNEKSAYLLDPRPAQAALSRFAIHLVRGDDERFRVVFCHPHLRGGSNEEWYKKALVLLGSILRSVNATSLWHFSRFHGNDESN